MTPQNAREYIPLLEALADGELQCNHLVHGWLDMGDADFSSPPRHTRSKRRLFPPICWRRMSSYIGLQNIKCAAILTTRLRFLNMRRIRWMH